MNQGQQILYKTTVLKLCSALFKLGVETEYESGFGGFVETETIHCAVEARAIAKKCIQIMTTICIYKNIKKNLEPHGQEWMAKPRLTMKPKFVFKSSLSSVYFSSTHIRMKKWVTVTKINCGYINILYNPSGTRKNVSTPFIRAVLNAKSNEKPIKNNKKKTRKNNKTEAITYKNTSKHNGKTISAPEM